MKTYIGTKIVIAEPMTENKWLEGKNQESQGREGYLVTYDNSYQAWSPKDVFDTHYREVTESEKEMI